MNTNLTAIPIQEATVLMRTEGWPCPACKGQGEWGECVRACVPGTPYCGHRTITARCQTCEGEATERCNYCGTAKAEVEVDGYRYCMDDYESGAWT